MPATPAPTRAVLAALLLLASALPARGDGVPLGPVPGDAQARPSVLADGSGGAVVLYKTIAGGVGATRVDGAGVPVAGPRFDPVAAPFTLEAPEPLRAWLPPGGGIVVSADRSSAGGAVATRLGEGGTAEAGFPVGLGMAMVHPELVPGLGGRTLLVAKHSDGVSFWTLRAAILGPAGEVEHAIQLPSQLQFFNVDRIAAAADGEGGLIAVMSHYDALLTGSKDLSVFRLAADGSMPWGGQPRPVVSQPRDQVDPRIVSDGAGGAFLVWSDPRAVKRSSDIFVLRLNSLMGRPPGWPWFGHAVCDATGPQIQPRMVRDGLGGIWVAWIDQRDGPDGDLRYSHVLPNGYLAPGFTRAGAVLCAAPGVQRELELAPDGAGGFFAVWRDERSGEPDLYLHHVLPSGAPAEDWPEHGLPLALAPGAQDQPAIAAVSGGRVVVAWRDAREGVARVYAAAVHDANTLEAGGPQAAGLALSAADPAFGRVTVRVTLPHAGTAELELLDVTGRRVASRTLAGPLHAGEVALEPGAPAPPGLYLVRLRVAGRQALARVSLLR
jgi:hypothetical protein